MKNVPRQRDSKRLQVPPNRGRKTLSRGTLGDGGFLTWSGSAKTALAFGSDQNVNECFIFQVGIDVKSALVGNSDELAFWVLVDVMQRTSGFRSELGSRSCWFHALLAALHYWPMNSQSAECTMKRMLKTRLLEFVIFVARKESTKQSVVYVGLYISLQQQLISAELFNFGFSLFYFVATLQNSKRPLRWSASQTSIWTCWSVATGSSAGSRPFARLGRSGAGRRSAPARA